VDELVVATALRTADVEPPAAAVVEDSALSECATTGTSLLSIPPAGTVRSTVMESQTTTEDSALSDCYSSGAMSCTSLLSISQTGRAPAAVMAELPHHIVPQAATTEDMLLHPAPVKSIQPVLEAPSAQASPMNAGGSEDLAAALRSALAQVVEEAKACLVAEQQAEDARDEAGDEEDACIEAEHEDPAEVKYLRRSLAVVDDCSSTTCTVSMSATTMTTPTNVDAATTTAAAAGANLAAAAEAGPEAESEMEVDAYAKTATDASASTVEAEVAQEIWKPLGDFHGLASTTSCHSDCNMASSLPEDQTSQPQMIAEECRARDSGDFGEVMPLVTPERGVDAGRKAELACALECSAHEVESEAAPETPGLTPQMAKKPNRRESMTVVAFELAQRAKETEAGEPTAVATTVTTLSDIAPRRVSVTWMLRRGWRSTGGGASPVTTTPPRLRQITKSRSCKQHDGSAQANRRSDQPANMSSAAQKTVCVLLGATCAVFTLVELAWWLGPDPEHFS